jgi:NAD(P)-dependent dehydrogenase (short-subunit alcohol dehydrogenase family)
VILPGYAVVKAIFPTHNPQNLLKIGMPIYGDLKGKVVLLTGGANGIGEATVRALHDQGARVYFCDIDANAGKSLSAELGAGVFFSKVDLRQEKQVRAWVESVGKGRRQIDVLVNNAAADPRMPLEAMTAKAWDDLFALNLRAYFLTSQAAVPYMRRGGESIVNLASIVFHQGPARLSAYVATKSGIIGLTRSLARELGPRRIRVNAVSPGWVMTERQLREHVTPQAKKTILTRQCIPDLLQPDELAEVILFLASDASRALTGQELLADRGWYHS